MPAKSSQVDARGAHRRGNFRFWLFGRYPDPQNARTRFLAALPVTPPLAVTNKYLARTNKSRTGANATNKQPAAQRNFVRCQPARARCGVSAAGSSPPLATRNRAGNTKNANRCQNEHRCAGPRMLRFAGRGTTSPALDRSSPSPHKRPVPEGSVRTELSVGQPEGRARSVHPRAVDMQDHDN